MVRTELKAAQLAQQRVVIVMVVFGGATAASGLRVAGFEGLGLPATVDQITRCPNLGIDHL